MHESNTALNNAVIIPLKDCRNERLTVTWHEIPLNLKEILSAYVEYLS